MAAIPSDEGTPPLLWYIRRRAVPYESRIAGVAVAVSGGDEDLKVNVDNRLATLGLTQRVNRLAAVATPFADARMYALLGSPRISASTVLTASAVRDLEAVAPVDTTITPTPGSNTGTAGPTTTGPIGPTTTLPVSPTTTGPIGSIGVTPRPVLQPSPILRPLGQPQQFLSEGDVLDVATKYGDPRLGDGLDSLTDALRDEPLGQDGELWLGGTGQALDLDSVVRDADATALPKIADGLVKAVNGKNADALTRLIASVH